MGGCRSCRRRDVRVCKPNLVCPARVRGAEPGRLSSIWDGRRRPPQAAHLRRAPNRPAQRCGRGNVGGSPPRRQGRHTALLGLAPRGVCLADLVTEAAGALLPHLCTPYTDGAETAFRHRCGTVLCCTCRLHHASAEPGSVQNPVLPCRTRRSLPVRKHGPCGIRTFLTADREGRRAPRPRRSDNPIRTSYSEHSYPDQSSGYRAARSAQ